jgi:hypothetical protein
MKGARAVWRELGEGGSRGKAVLIGNGPNLLSGRLSWACLLHDLSGALATYPLLPSSYTSPLPHKPSSLPSTNTSLYAPRHPSGADRLLEETLKANYLSKEPAEVDVEVVMDEQGLLLDADKPFSMIYEELYLTAMRRNRSKGMKETQVKRVIADMVRRQLQPNGFHQQLMATAGCRHVLTTNYDYNLEWACLGPSPDTDLADPDRVQFVNETVHSLFRRHEVKVNGGSNPSSPFH